ncbi:MAG: IS200/IS605 family transposase [Patescibacteria group bacterium]
MSQKYHHSSSSKYLCKIHLIFATKYRKKLLQGAIEEGTKQILFEISQESDFTIDVMESDIDHIHILIDYPPKLSISSIVNRLKSMSTRRVYQKHSVFLKSQYWKENTFWSDGYFVCTTGDACTEIIKKYIEQQG